MSRWETRLVDASAILVGGTGLVYAWMRYLLAPQDPWAVINHPWQPVVQHLHVFTAPLLVFALGLIWRGHVTRQWRDGEHRRRTGIFTALSLTPMIASGYLLQITVAQGWRSAWVVIHVATATLWIAGFVGHRLLGLGRRASAPAVRPVRDLPPSERLDSPTGLTDPGAGSTWN